MNDVAHPQADKIAASRLAVDGRGELPRFDRSPVRAVGNSLSRFRPLEYLGGRSRQDPFAVFGGQEGQALLP